MLKTAPTEEPITSTEAKLHLRVDHTADDNLITILIASARRWTETITRRAFVSQTWYLKLDSFGFGHCDGRIYLPKPPLQSITSISYVDAEGTTQVLGASSYQVVNADTSTPRDACQGYGYVVPAYGTTWPATKAQPDAVTIEYVAGYGAAADVPAIVKAGVCLALGDLYARRDVSPVGAAAMVLAPVTVAPLRWLA